MKTTVSHSPATACPPPDLWHYPHVPLHLAESQVSPVTDLSHGCVSLLGNLQTQENHSPLDTSQDSRACTFPCISWVLVAEGKGGSGVPRAVHYQPEVQMKQINSSSTWGATVLELLLWQLTESALELPKYQPKWCCPCFSSLPPSGVHNSEGRLKAPSQ